MRIVNRLQMLVAACALSFCALATASDITSMRAQSEQTQFILDARLRHEAVDQAPFARDANATTLRVRAGFETKKLLDTALVADAEFIWALGDEYRADNAMQGDLRYPVVADGESEELNRLHIVNTALPGTSLSLGRQRIVLDDERFVGNVGWRQNEQTFDAVRVVSRLLPSLTLDATYLNQVNRVFGPESPQGRYQGDGRLFNVSHEFALGKATAFGYLLDFEPISAVSPALDPIRMSTKTYGVRIAGGRTTSGFKMGYVGSYAIQQDYGTNPFAFDLDYYMVELSADWRGFGIGVGQETLEGNGEVGFATPLATLHRFQGWADKFLTTPANGIDDHYVSVGMTRKGLGGFQTVAASAVYHEFQTERLAIDLGSELDLQLQVRWRGLAAAIKYTRYEAREARTPIEYRDTKKFWIVVEYALRAGM